VASAVFVNNNNALSGVLDVWAWPDQSVKIQAVICGICGRQLWIFTEHARLAGVVDAHSACRFPRNSRMNQSLFRRSAYPPIRLSE
jgi:hypothetical protein